MTHTDPLQRHSSLLLNRITRLRFVVILIGPANLHILHLNSGA